jgi:hypothetical protein
VPLQLVQRHYMAFIAATVVKLVSGTLALGLKADARISRWVAICATFFQGTEVVPGWLHLSTPDDCCFVQTRLASLSLSLNDSERT